MKKFNYLLLGLAGLAMASCSQEDLVGPAGDGNVQFHITIPGALGTRATELGTGYNANQLMVAVYENNDGDDATTPTLGEPVIVSTSDFGFTTNGNDDDLTTNVNLNLASGKSYYVAFFAASEASLTGEKPVYKFDTGANQLVVDYTAMDSDENVDNSYECFYKLFSTGKIGANGNTFNVLLNRPVAQINWGTNDDMVTESNLYQEIINTFGEDGEYIVTNAQLTNVPNVMNFADLTVSGANTVTLNNFAAPYEAAFPVEGYNYVAMQYVLAGQTSANSNLTLTITNKANQGATEVTNDVVVTEAPFQANYRTNIYGSLLSDNVSFVVEKNQEWGNPDYEIVYINGEPYQVIKSNIASKLNKGGNFILGEDVTYPAPTSYLALTKSTNLDLGGYTLSTYGNVPSDPSKATGDGIVVGNGANVTISNGTLNAPKNALSDGSSATINLMTPGGGTLTLNDVNVIGSSYPVMLTSSNPNAEIIINSGNYTWTEEWQNSTDATDEKLVAVYVTSSVGHVTINGGTFGMPGITSNYLLNVYDSSRNGRQPNEIITVKGGTFINFDPSHNKAEGEWTNFVADGYKVVASTNGNDTYYMVVPSSEEVVTTTEELSSAIENADNGATINVGAGEVTIPVNFPAGKSITIKGLGSDITTLKANMAYNTSENSTINLSDLTLETFVANTHTSMGFEGAKAQTYTNVKFVGEFHVFSGTATFDNCEFEYYAPSQTNYLLWCQSQNGTTTLNNCTMTCGNGKAILVYAGDNVFNANGGNVTINGLNVTSPSSGDKAVVEIHSEHYISAGTIIINDVTYPTAEFVGLWREIYNTGALAGEKTDYYKVIVNGTVEQEGGFTGEFTGNN